MSPLNDGALDRLEASARAFQDEAARLEAAGAQTVTISNEGATVTVDAWGRLVDVAFPPAQTSLDRWNHWFGEAYTRALEIRPEVHAATEVPGPPGQRPSDRPRAPEQELVAARIRADQEQALATMAEPAVTDGASTATSGGVRVTVNALEVIIDAQASLDALRDHQTLDEHVMAAYRAACRAFAPPTF